MLEPPRPFDRVVSKLYQGSVPDPKLGYEDFTMIVLCAEECQPALPKFRGRILRPAFDDTVCPTKAEMDRARQAAVEVASEMRRGGRVLVTCAAGLNRSGLVCGLALSMSTRSTAKEIVGKIRAARGEYALSNSTFSNFVFNAVKMRDQVLRHGPRERRDRRADRHG